jgi:hypothetical protein
LGRDFHDLEAEVFGPVVVFPSAGYGGFVDCPGNFFGLKFDDLTVALSNPFEHHSRSFKPDCLLTRLSASGDLYVKKVSKPLISPSSAFYGIYHKKTQYIVAPFLVQYKMWKKQKFVIIKSEDRTIA